MENGPLNGKIYETYVITEILKSFYGEGNDPELIGEKHANIVIISMSSKGLCFSLLEKPIFHRRKILEKPIILPIITLEKPDKRSLNCV